MKLAFKAHFEPKIKEGSKIHTIRSCKKTRWKKDSKIEMVVKDPGKDYRCFGVIDCTGTQRIFMTYQWGDYLSISIGIREITHKEQEDLAFNSGFECYDDFFNWFYKKIKADPNEQFSGKIIHWTNKRY